METWHFPPLAPLYPDLGQRMLSYRSSRLAAARADAQAAGVAGAMFPLESGLLGRNVCAWLVGSQHEIHTTGDVAMAHRLQYRLTRNASWLASSWPVIEGCAQFWASRVTPSTSVPGGFTVLQAIGTDERAGVVDDDAYTNAIAAETLRFASWVAGQVGAPPGANWSAIASGIVLPVVKGVYSDGPIHIENRQYKTGQQIEQSDVGLLQYPLDIPMNSTLKINDLT
jgi:trehalose/maltose hydrolase-like predicted phosphorylase